MVGFTKAVLETMEIEALPSGDWKQLARACFSGGDNLLWKTEFHGQCEITANTNRSQHIPITLNMLSEESDYKDTENQSKFNVVVYTQLSFASKKTWIKLPGPG